MSDKLVVSAMSSSTAVTVNEKSGRIRVTDYKQTMAFRETETGTEIAFHSHEDPRGLIPKWLVNLASKNLAPKYFKVYNNACDDYDSWEQKNIKHNDLL